MRATPIARPAAEDAPTDGFVFCVREWFGKGAGAGDLLSEHWHGPPCEPCPLLQQQHDPLLLQHVACCAEDAAIPPQQE